MVFRKADDVVARTLGQTFYLVNVGKFGAYYGFGGLGREIWEALIARESIETISQAIAQEHGISMEQAEYDVRLFVQDLCAEGLITEEGQ